MCKNILRKTIFCPSNINIIEAKKRKKKKKNCQPKLLKAGFCLLGSAGNLNSNLNAWRKFLIIRFGNINLTFADVLISDNGYSQTDHENALCSVQKRKTATLIKHLPSARNNSLQQLCPCVQVINKREYMTIKICFMCMMRYFTPTWFTTCTLPS